MSRHEIRSLRISVMLLLLLVMFPPMVGRNGWSHWTTHRFVLLSRVVAPDGPVPPKIPNIGDLVDVPAHQLPIARAASETDALLDPIEVPSEGTSPPPFGEVILPSGVGPKYDVFDLITAEAEYRDRTIHYEVAWAVLGWEVGAVLALCVFVILASFHFTNAVLAAVCLMASGLALYAPRSAHVSEDVERSWGEDAFTFKQTRSWLWERSHGQALGVVDWSRLLMEYSAVAAFAGAILLMRSIFKARQKQQITAAAVTGAKVAKDAEHGSSSFT